MARFRLDPANQCLWQDDRRVEIAPKDFQVLHYLMSRPNRLVSKQELIREAWEGAHVTPAALSVVIARLREILGDDARAPAYIETVHRSGYRWIGVTPDDAPAAIASTPSRPIVSPIVGRDTQLAQLDEALARANSGQRQLVFVTGEAGIGKTALVDHFVARIGRSDALLLARGQCLEHFGAGEAYLPCLEAFGRLLRQPAQSDLVPLLRQNAPTWLVQLPFLITPDDREALQREIEGGTRERMLREFAAAVTAFAADRTLVLILEDLHWSDPSTIALIGMLAQRRERTRLLILGTFRPVDAVLASHPVNDLKRQAVSRGIATEIALPLLAMSDVEEYLRRRFATDAIALAARLQRRTDGNPLFLVNVLDDLLARRGQDDDSLGQLDPELIDTDEMPNNLRQMIERQLDRLDPEDARILEAASIVGSEIVVDALAAAADADPGEVESRCERLSRRGAFVQRSNHISGGSFSFHHALHQSVLYQRQAPARRMQAHRRVADWLAAHLGSPAEITHHLLQAGAAGDLARLVEYSALAAERARSLFAFEEALAHYHLAIQHLPQGSELDAQRCALAIGRGEVEERAGRIAQANDTFLKAAALGRQIGDPRLLARAALGLGRAYQQVGQVNAELIQLLRDALAALPAEELSLRAKALARLTWALCAVAGTEAERKQLTDEANALARSSNDPGTLIWVAQYTRWSFSAPQPIAQMRLSTDELAALASRITDKEQRLMLHLLRTTDLLEIGDVDEADSEVAALRALVDETQIPWFRWILGRIDTVRALHEGRLDEAERLAAEAVESARGMDHPNVLPLFAAQTVVLRWQQGRSSEAETMVGLFVEQNPSVIAWRAFHACLLIELDERDEARRQFEILAKQEFSDIPQDSLWLNTIAFLAVACANLGDAKRAATLYDQLLPYGDRCIGMGTSTFALGHASRYLALLATTLGRKQEAAALFAKAIRENTRLRALPWVEATQRDAARLQLSF